MNYLNRIIAVNSFLVSSGKIDVYDIKNGTAILGSNTKGKSSFLRTQLLFYGAKPEQIANLSGNSNLTKFYFSTLSSYLVFEYIKDDKPYMVVTYSTNNSLVTYRFVTGEFSEDLFARYDEIEGKKVFIPNTDLKKHLRECGRSMSDALGYQDYAAIIQNGKFERGGGDKGRKRNEYRQLYSICPRNVEITGADRIALSIIDSSPSIETIKRLLAQDVSTMGEDIKLKLTQHTGEIESRNRDMKIVRQANEFKKHAPRVTQLKANKQTILQNSARLKGLKFECEQLLESHVGEAEKLDGEFNGVQSSQIELKSKYDAEAAELNTQIGQNQASLNSLLQEITNLESRYRTYQENGIDQDGILAKKIQTIEADITTINARKTELTERYDTIINHYDNEFMSFKEQREEYLKPLRSQTTQKVSELHRKIALANAEQPSQEDGIRKRYATQKESLTNQKTKLASKIATLSAALKNPESVELAQIKAQLANVQKELQNLKHNELTLTQSLVAAKGELTEKTRERDKRLQEHENLKRDKEEQEALHERLIKELADVESMLYFKVLAVSPDKAELMAKTLREDVLKAKAPDDLVVSSDNGLLGIDFDFTKFDSIRPDAKEVIENKLRQCSDRLSNLSRSIDQVEVLLKSLNGEIVDAGGEVRRIEMDIGTCGNQLSSEKTNEEQILIKLETEEQRVKSNVQEDILACSKEDSTLEEKLKVLDADSEKEIAAIRQKTAETISVFKSDIESTEANLANLEISVQNEIKHKKQEIESAKDVALSKEGAQIELINQTEKDLEQKGLELTQAKQAQERYREYQSWLSDSYCHLDSKKTISADLDELLVNQRESARIRKEAFEEEYSILQVALDDLDKRRKKIESEVVILQGLLSHGDTEFSRLSSEKYFNRPTPSAADIQIDVQRFSKENAGLMERGRQEFGSLTRSFRNYPELVELCSEILARENYLDVGSANDWVESIDSLAMLFSGSLENAVKARIDSFKVLGDQLVELNGILDKVDESIGMTGRRITKHMGTTSSHFGAIKGLSATIGSKISLLPFKKELVKASEVINRTKGMEPDENFFRAVTSAVNALQSDSKSLDVANMINVTINLEDKSGKRHSATTDNELAKISSEGMSFLILIMIFVAIKNSVSQNSGVEILWSLDEIGRIHPENVQIISDILRSEQISFLCAGPSVDAKVGSLFQNLYEIREDKETGRDYVVKIEAQETAIDMFNSLSA